MDGDAFGRDISRLLWSLVWIAGVNMTALLALLLYVVLS